MPASIRIVPKKALLGCSDAEGTRSPAGKHGTPGIDSVLALVTASFSQLGTVFLVVWHVLLPYAMPWPTGTNAYARSS